MMALLPFLLMIWLAPSPPFVLVPTVNLIVPVSSVHADSTDYVENPS